MMKWISFCSMFIFAVVAAVQYNDPDGLRWMLLYGAVAFCSGWNAMVSPGNVTYYLTAFLALISAGWALWLVPMFLKFVKYASLNQLFSSQKMKGGKVEFGREFIGLVIVMVVCLFEFYRSRTVLNRSSEE